jgi:superfamily II DNA or RNA helicase
VDEDPVLPIKATFATNRPDQGETVAQAISGHLDWLDATWKKPFSLAIATAYINPGGFSAIESALCKAGHVRLLIGAEPKPPIERIRPLGEDEKDETRHALQGHDRSMEEDRNLLGFTQLANTTAQRMVEWLRSGVVDVRRFEDGFLHGKAYLVDTDDEGVIAGSSNFTWAGLNRNRELNLGHYDPKEVGPVREWFEEMWGLSVPYDLAAVFEARFLPHSPHLIYLRMLYEKYGRDVEAMAEASGFGLHLAQFQKDGVTLARMIVDRYNGVIVADGVGLGKTFVAGELIREAIEDRRQRVLVVAPAALRDGPWRTFRAQQAFNFSLVSYDELSMDRQLNPDHPNAKAVLELNLNDYALVVVDEAHAYRNPGAQRAEVLNRLLEGWPPKSLVLLTATPVNNSLWDLYNLLAYFVRNDAVFASVGISSLREKFKRAAAVDPDTLAPEHLYDVLAPVVVRRTRSYVKHYYPDAEITVRGEKKRVSFPKPEVKAVTYEMRGILPGLLDRFAAALDPDPATDDPARLTRTASERRAAGEDALTFARYIPSSYLLSGEFEAHEGQVAGLLRSGLLKRFESSVHAFANTCETMADSHDAFLFVLDQGYVATGKALRELATSDSDELDSLIEARGDEWETTLAKDYDVDRLREDVEGDRDLMRAWAAEARRVAPEHDPKLDALLEALAEIVADAKADVHETSTERDRLKVLVFSYFTDTVDWVAGFLTQALTEPAVLARYPELATYRDRLMAVSGRGGDDEQRTAMFGFAPITTEAPTAEDRFDLLVTTDVLAEGVNLQQARNIINYDLPWNPQRLVQRHGRIDRIGSAHSRIWLRCFMPDQEINLLLGLEERLHRKITQAARSIGTEGTIIPGSEVSDRAYTETREAIEEIRRGETSFLDENQGSMSVEEYRQQLREGLLNPELARQIKRLAWGSGSGKAVEGAEPGFVFCARVGDSQDPQYRYVNVADPAEPVVVSDILSCLRHAHATNKAERVLDEATHALAYDAWAVAKRSIFDSWLFATDPRNLQPEIPKVMRDAAELVRTYPPAELDQSEVDRLVDTLNSPYAERVRRQIREAINGSETAAAQVAGILAVVRRLSLTPAPTPKALPIIEDEDIHLVCWMATVPGVGQPRDPDGDRLTVQAVR